MKFVVDSNVLFTFFWKNSVFSKLSVKQDLKLFSPMHALEEISKYSSDILKKTRLSQEEFKKLRRELATRVEFIPQKEYSPFLKLAKSLLENLPKEHSKELLDDIDFVALALKLNCSIWSNDKLLKSQSMVKVFSTKEIILFCK